MSEKEFLLMYALQSFTALSLLFFTLNLLGRSNREEGAKKWLWVGAAVALTVGFAGELLVSGLPGLLVAVIGAIAAVGGICRSVFRKSFATSCVRKSMREKPLPEVVIERLSACGWSTNLCEAGVYAVHKRGSRGQIQLPEGVAEELSSAGWSVTYQGAQFIPPYSWVSRKPIELEGFYRIERK